MSKEEKEIKNNETAAGSDVTSEKPKKEKPAKEKKPFNTRKLKYGSLSAAITAVFIAAVVLLNVFASQLTDRYGLKIDTTKEQLFEISDTTIDYLKGLQEDVTIDVMADEAELDTGSKFYKLEKEVAEKYAQNSDRIKVNFYDIEKHPEIVTKYSAYTTENISKASVVVFCDGRIKVLQLSDFYEIETNYQTYEQSIKAITAEEKLTSAIMFVADPNPPTVAVLSCQQSDAVRTSVSQLPTILENNGYTVETVDPLTQDIKPEYSALILAAPYSDLTETVIEKIRTYLENGGNYGKNLIYFASFDQRETPNLDAFLEEWGIKVGKGYVSNVNSAELLKIGIAGLQNYYVVPQAKLTSGNESLVKSNDLPVAMPMARPLELTFSEGDGRETEVILKTSETSFVADENTTQDNMNDLPQAEQNVLVRGSKHKFVGEEKISSSIYACGSAFFIDYYITSTNALNNQELAVSLVNKCSGKDTGVTILSKSLVIEPLNISEKSMRTVVLLVEVCIPLAIALTGLAVYLRRRNR
ncbi:GldG family protein [Ruminococcus sp. HUN007]|uniref:GldG family protein n=1 Tax=Ruminococcus sp. HUN007 TaxID=1514668 RepID=UPI0005D29E4B|nr:GldG family protein [Ruminococcus sp. HUN007]